MTKLLRTILLFTLLLTGITSCQDNETETQLEVENTLTSHIWYSYFGDYEFSDDHTVELAVQNGFYEGTWDIEDAEASQLVINWEKFNSQSVDEYERWNELFCTSVLITAEIDSNLPELDGKPISLYKDKELLN